MCAPRQLLLAAAVQCAALLAALPSGAAGQTPPASYTTAQAETGAQAFQDNCAECHMADLSESDEGPPLADEYFAAMWGGRPVRGLLDFVCKNMPLARPGSLGEETYLALVAYLLASNGAPAGDAPLTMGSEGVVAPAK